jgi:asparagine synthase (glutamine-hydrolysing)
MSLIWGFYSYDNDYNKTLNQQMYAPIQDLPHIKHHFEIQKNVGMGHMLVANTPEAVYENLPVYLEKEQVLFTAQGRIDNRAELARKLGLKIDGRYTDGKLILQSYLKWKSDCVSYLRGDWSFAVFDCSNQELFIARDQMGYTSLYYYQDETGFYFSSSIKSLLSLPGYKKKLNELHFVRHLTLWDDSVNKHSTYFKDISSLPIAHILFVKNRKITQQQYWHPENTPIQFRKNILDYTSEMNEVFQSAVNARLRSLKPIASMLSGGLDSSAVSYVAAELLKKSNTPLTALSHVPLYTNEIKQDQERHRRILDETPFIVDIVNASQNITPIFLTSKNQSIVAGMKEALNVCNAPFHGAANLYWLYDIYQTASLKGFGTLLTGEGGNGSISFAGIDYQLPLKLNRFFANPYMFLKIQGAKKIAKKFFNNQLNNRRDVNNNLLKYVSSIFLKEKILIDYDIKKNIAKNNQEIHTYITNIQEAKEQFIDSYYLRSLRGGICGHYYGFELRDPCTDVDLMEYFFSIPNEAFFDNHYNNRMLVKRMMRGKIPDNVLFEKRKGLQSADIAYRVKAQSDEITETVYAVNQSAVANEYINTKELAETWKTYLKADYTQPYQIQRLLKALHFALFLHMNFD